MLNTKVWWETNPRVGVKFWNDKPDITTPMWKYILNELQQYKTVTDVGCGNGVVSQYCKNYVGIDITKKLMTANQLKYPDKTFIWDSFLNLDEQSECVLCSKVLEHLPHFDAGLRWCMEQAEKAVIVTTHTPWVPVTLIRYEDSCYNNHYSLEEIKSHVDYYGWKIAYQDVLQDTKYQCPILKLVPAS